MSPPPPSMSIAQAVACLKRGELVAFPTETVYGLGADGTNPNALKALYEVKARPTNHPIILHLGHQDWLSEYAQTSAIAETLVEAFWPGPLTLILPKTDKVPLEATGGQNTVGLRMPQHPMALELIRSFGKALAAPSANRFGRISPTTAEHVWFDLGEEIAGVLDGGATSLGLESTVLDLTAVPAVLRPGGVTNSEIEAVLGFGLGLAGKTRAPGTLKSHYAPRVPCSLCSRESLLEKCAGRAVLARFANPGTGTSLWIQASADPVEYARDLYANLRQLDELGPQRILIEELPSGEAWDAARDRLEKATAVHPSIDE